MSCFPKVLTKRKVTTFPAPKLEKNATIADFNFVNQFYAL